ncbi:Methyltransferase type 11 [Kalmanozyma brasiliensis GHG001]|uniref:Methyltransferase domain-containing protein n=1 Tax=Kalmanozyma brasiliensis (strain GHG001) TaxID=1365824 RepID=V5GTA1_KALBG|nr:Methyltransferase type 11 [Kalmanozyma brasiliensis GHG001]EST09132.1 Methyltransferase type 11 [Kalmanozyma brasiliensis GHG001]
MSSDPVTGSLATAGESAAEASTSALPTTSSTATEAPTAGPSLFDPLFEAKNSLNHQSEASTQLHPLNSALQSLYSASTSDGRLSRDQYRQLIAQIRHSLSQFAATNPALKSQQSSYSAQQAVSDPTASNQLRRYISLLTETSTHTAALAHSIAPIKSADRPTNSAATRPSASLSFPRQLQTGVFLPSTVEQPTSSWEAALQTLAALCETLDSTAKSLGLETFSEPSPDAAAPTRSSPSDVLTHTLTLGAKILVIDIELHVVKDSALGGFRPKAKLKLSYATDSPDPQHARDPRLGAVLERDVQLIADKLFGPAASSALQQDRTVVARALTNWTSNLNELLVLDDLEARASEAASEGSRSTDLFAAMQNLSVAAKRVSDAEAASSSASMLDGGHGVHKLHESRPFLHAVFAHDPTSKQDYTLSLGVQALDLPTAEQTLAYATTPSFPLSQAAQDLLSASAASDPAKHLGSVPSPVDAKKRIPLHFIVRLDPPVVVSRPTAAKLASICNLKQTPPHNTAAAPAAPSGATWFEDVLAASWSQRASQDARRPTRCTFTLAQTIESVRSTQEQGLVIDSLPLLSPASGIDAMDESDATRKGGSTLARLFAAIEVLRDEVKVTELMHSAIATSETTAEVANGKADDLSLDDLLSSGSNGAGSKIPVTLAFHTPIQGATDESQQNLSLRLAFRVLADTGATVAFDATISPSKRTSESGWLLSAVARPESSDKEARLDSDSPEAQSIIAKLTDLSSLEDVVIGLVDWAAQSLSLNLQKPTAQENGFNPLDYEQQNVHAIYETIAPHFSNTRYKPWPLIPAFLSTVPPGSLGADLGCGNGKYLPIRSILTSGGDGENSLLTLGVDRSSNLVGLAQHNFPSAQPNARHEVTVGDALACSLRAGVFDYAISIATIHHFSTRERRMASVQELIRLLAPSDAASSDSTGGASSDPRMTGSGTGRFLIFVWALEQGDEGKRQFQGTGGKEIDDPNHSKSKDRLVSYSSLGEEQDVLVPWVLSKPKPPKAKGAPAAKAKRKDKISSAEEIQTGLEKLDVNPPAPEKKVEEERPVYNRYYHMFCAGELETLVAEAAASMPAVHRRGGALEKVRVVRECGGWERGNWWGVWQVRWAE